MKWGVALENEMHGDSPQKLLNPARSGTSRDLTPENRKSSHAKERGTAISWLYVRL